MTDNVDGVFIPQEAIDGSNAKKKAKRSLRQLPIYRDMSNLKYMVVCLYDSLPRKMTKYIDTMLSTVCEAKKCVGLAESSRDREERMQYLRLARVFVEDIHDDARRTFVKRVACVMLMDSFVSISDLPYAKCHALLKDWKTVYLRVLNRFGDFSKPRAIKYFMVLPFPLFYFATRVSRRLS